MIDDRIRSYYALHGRALNMVETSGRVYDPSCWSCGGSTRHWKDEGELWVCGVCPDGLPWKYQEEDILKGQVKRSPRPGATEDRLVDLVAFGYALNQLLEDAFWRWPAQVMVGFALTTCDYLEIASHACEFKWPSPSGRPWTEPMAEDWADRARRELAGRFCE